MAGEIMKILVNHPDVELSWVTEPAGEGALLSAVHKGLRGETYMRFSSVPDMEEIDVLFLCCDEPGMARRYVKKHPVPEKVKIVDLSGDFLPESTFADGDNWIFGLPELSGRRCPETATSMSQP